MIFIIGGKYQGKLEYALKKYGVRPEEVRTCVPGGEIDFSGRVISGLEVFVRSRAEEGQDFPEVKAYIDLHKSDFEYKIVIMSDETQGLVPMDPLDRAYRELAGRTAVYLASVAETVERVFCGLGEKLK